MKKYEFTGETKIISGIEMKRIRSLVNIERYGIKNGDIGGWIEKEDNISFYGDAWVYGDAWKESPLYIHGTKFCFCICSKNEIKIGCHVHSFAAWKRNWKRIAKENGFPDEKIKEYILYFNMACDLYGKEKYKIDLLKDI